MVGVMKEMTKILKMNETNLDMKNVQKTMQQFMLQMEKQEMMSGILPIYLVILRTNQRYNGGW
jgi:hypothetical protein